MLLLDKTCESTWADIALDELLLLDAEAGEATSEVLRLWHAKQKFIVLGRSSKAEQEVQLELARSDGIPVIRRSSGGATVMAAKGCMFYAVLLSLTERPHLRMLDKAHEFVMGTVLKAVKPLREDVSLDGTCDLVTQNKKVSGNSLRVQRNWLIYHGTLLIDMDLTDVAKYLKHPPREPEYRGGRGHSEFLANLDVDPAELKLNLSQAWNVEGDYGAIDNRKLERLVEEKYSKDSWNLQR